MREEQVNVLKKAAEEVGCFGLAEGVAKNLYTQQSFYASECTVDDGPFYCPLCFSDAVLRKCTEKRDHFAHKARLSPVIGAGEGELHYQCKQEILFALQNRFPDGKWADERPIPENKSQKIPELRPDLSGRINDIPIAIEVQASTLTLSKIIKRAVNYSRKGIYLLWVVPLTEPLGSLPFRPRLYERYLHSMYFGRTYYWWPSLGSVVKPVHYGAATRHVEYRSWHEQGMLMEGGNYDATYKIVKTPEYGADVNIADDFISNIREKFVPENERKEVPKCNIWRDNLQSWW